MSDTEADSAPDPAEDHTFDELRDAAGAVIASLKWFIDATERVVQDPANFSRVVENGRSVLSAFADGFAAQASAPEEDREPDR